MAKYCNQCKQFKKERQFRYIKYFKKYRNICKRCEAVNRRKHKFGVERHVKQHGVTPGILRKLQDSSYQKAMEEAKDKVFSTLPTKQQKQYNVAQWVLSTCNTFLFLLFFVGNIGLFVGATGGTWKWLGYTCLTALILYVAQYYCERCYMDHINSEIQNHINLIYDNVFKQEVNERKTYEKFYRTPEWRILRKVFLRTQNKINSHYICYLCQKPIYWRDLTIDHLKPRSKFPDLALEITNLRLAHRQCNSSKGDRFHKEK